MAIGGNIMKTFKLKKDYTVKNNASKKENRAIKTDKHKLFNTLWKTALSYAKKNSYYDGMKEVKCGYSFHLWVRDERYWCKKVIDDETYVFEYIVEISILSLAELKLLIAKECLGWRSKEEIIEMINSIDDKGDIENVWAD